MHIWTEVLHGCGKENNCKEKGEGTASQLYIRRLVTFDENMHVILHFTALQSLSVKEALSWWY